MKYTKETVEQICRNLEVGLSKRDSCILADITEETFYTWLKEHPDFSESVEKAIGKFKSNNLKIIQLAASPKRTDAKGNVIGGNQWQAGAWLLERRYPKEFGIRQQIDFNIQSVIMTVSAILNRNVPEKCPCCAAPLSIKDGIIRELEMISQDGEQTKSTTDEPTPNPPK
jgi:hypothetical protein